MFKDERRHADKDERRHTDMFKDERRHVDMFKDEGRQVVTVRNPMRNESRLLQPPGASRSARLHTYITCPHPTYIRRSRVLMLVHHMPSSYIHT